jgi:hypothetical protein
MKKVSGFPSKDSSPNPAVKSFRDNKCIYMFILIIYKLTVSSAGFPPAAFAASAEQRR